MLELLSSDAASSGLWQTSEAVSSDESDTTEATGEDMLLADPCVISDAHGATLLATRAMTSA